MRPPRRQPTSSTALALGTSARGLAVIEPTGTEVAIPAELINKAKGYAAKSKSKRTLEAYAFWWKKFQRWCDTNGREALPARIETVIAFLVWLADGQPGATRRLASLDGHRLSVASLSVVLSAIKFRHKSKGYKLDTDDPALQQVWAGIRRDMALRRTTRKAAALTAEQLREILDQQRAELPREARNAALLALGVTATLRRSEIVGLDWGKMGEGEDEARLGYLETDDSGLRVVLMKSKASQDTAQDVPIPEEFAPIIVRTILNWVKVAGIKPGTPLFRGIKGRGHSDKPQSGYIGVSWNEKNKRYGKPWLAQAPKNGKTKHLGFHATPLEAHLARCQELGCEPQPPNEGAIMDKRMDIMLPGMIIKSCIKRWLVAQRKRKGLKRLTTEELHAEVAKYSSHSMRAGGITSMARAGVPVHKIKEVSRHKEDGMVSEYIRSEDKKTKWAMKGVAF